VRNTAAINEIAYGRCQAGDKVVETPELTFPHPRLHLRRFVLVPFAEIAPEIVHPALGVSISNGGIN
jgi:7,8-dihydro-6-hydroxymethylpterin-pyrophosphokinase